jgi:hypothetical protein
MNSQADAAQAYSSSFPFSKKCLKVGWAGSYGLYLGNFVLGDFLFFRGTFFIPLFLSLRGALYAHAYYVSSSEFRSASRSCETNDLATAVSLHRARFARKKSSFC